MNQLIQDSSLFHPKMKVSEVNQKISWIITQKRHQDLSFLRELITHKSVSVRRKVAEAYRVLGEPSDIKFLEAWQPQEADRATFVNIETAIDAISRREKGDFSDFDSGVLTVGEALTKIKHVLGEKEYVIEAEITEAKNYYQMYYFTIKDTESEATINCRCFQNVVFRAGFPLNEGLQIRVTGKFVLDKYSRLLFDAKFIQLTGEGELLRNLKLLQEKLENEGLLDESRKRKPVRLPSNVLLLASPSSAAITDFTKVLGRRRGGVTVYHLPIKTQGVGAEQEIISRLSQANQVIREKNIDTVVLTRGGGSKEDLIVFNSEAVVRAIHSLTKPVIVAIGHERDTTLSELVADVRASTPSQAAELVSVSYMQVESEVSAMIGGIQTQINSRIHAYRSANEKFSFVIIELIRRRIQGARQTVQSVDQYVQRLIRAMYLQTEDVVRNCRELVRARIRQAKEELVFVQYLYPRFKQIVDNQLVITTQIRNQIIQKISTQKSQYTQEFLLAYQQIIAIHPKNILKNGYAIVESGGKSITRKSDIELDKNLSLSFFDGTLEVTPLSEHNQS